MCYVIKLILQIFSGFLGGYLAARGIKMLLADSKFLKKGLLHIICGVIAITLTILIFGEIK